MTAANQSVGDPLDQPLVVPRKRWGVRDRLVLALAPTAVVLVVYSLVEALSQQRLLFTSLAASAFLVYLGPQLRTNQARTLAISQLIAAAAGSAAYFWFGPLYLAAGLAMVATILSMVLLDVIHPPAVATALAFAFRVENWVNVLLFVFAVGLIAGLVIVQRAILRRVASRRRG